MAGVFPNRTDLRSHTRRYVHDPYSFRGLVSPATLVRNALYSNHLTSISYPLFGAPHEPEEDHHPRIALIPATPPQGRVSPPSSVGSSPSPSLTDSYVGDRRRRRPGPSNAMPTLTLNPNVMIGFDTDMRRFAQGAPCDHIGSWKRLRAKKGMNHLLCCACGGKWKVRCLHHLTSTW